MKPKKKKTNKEIVLKMMKAASRKAMLDAGGKMPINKVQKDKTKYSRKTKHRGNTENQ